jgi:hypothetical protein
MNSIFPRIACAASLLLCSVSVDAISTPAAAQGSFQIGFDAFHDQLSNYGDWVYSDRWGEVWVPGDVPDDFRPYDTNGYWAYTDEYGWYWASNYEWGDIPFHYGRWVNDPDDGWLWIPGYVWSPAWVIWRNNGQYTGWMAMPPDDAFLGVNDAGIGFSRGGVGISIDFNDMSGEYGYSRWYGRSYGRDRFAQNWVFIPTGHIADRDYHRYEAPRARYVTIMNNTRNITNYSVVNNYVVNRGVDFHAVQRAGGRPVVAVHASVVIHNPQFVVHADMGRQIQMQVRHDNPHGNGFANSAPQPSSRIVQSLSTNVNVHHGNGQAPAHLFTRTTVQNAPLKPSANGNGSPMGQHGNTMQGGAATGPNGNANDHRHDNNGAMTGGANANGTPPNTPANSGAGPTHRTDTNGAMGGGNTTPANNATGGPNGPAGENHHHENTNSGGTTGGAMGGGNSPTTPNNTTGGTGAPTGGTHHHDTTNTGGMSGGAMGGSSTPTPPNNTTGGANGPAGETHHHETTNSGGTTGGAMGGSSSTTPSSTPNGGMNGSQGETRHHETTTTGTTSGANTSTPPANPPSNPPPRHQDKPAASPTTGGTPPSGANGDPHENHHDNQAGGSQAGGDKDKNKDKDKKDENAPPP